MNGKLHIPSSTPDNTLPTLVRSAPKGGNAFKQHENAHPSMINLEDFLEKRETLCLTEGGSSAWRTITQASLEEYRVHHLYDGYPDSTKAIMAMFGGFIAKWALIWNSTNLIDLGCGIGTKTPPYVRGLLDNNLKYAGLDPLAENMERDYAFVCGRLEDLKEASLDKRFDLAVFATSLDHFEDPREALLLAGDITESGHVLIWCGLHDSPLIARIDVSDMTDRVCRENHNIISRTLGFLWYSIFTWPRVARDLRTRENKLETGQPLDKLHFSYFTESELKDLLLSIGQINEFAVCPGTNSVFVSLTVGVTTEPDPTPA